MLKKLMIGSAIAVGGVGLLVGAPFFSYVRSGVSSARQAIRESIPVEVEIKRARDMITDLKPEIADNLRVIAREEVEVNRLAEEVKNKQGSLAKGRKDILRLKDDIQTGSSHFVYASKTYTSDQVKDDLSNRFKQFQTQEATTAKLEKILEARTKNLDAARRKLDEMLAAKRQLEVEVENLQARLTMVQVAETSSKVHVNDSHLSRTRELLDDIRSRIDVAEKMIENEGVLEGNIPLEEQAPADLVDQITDYFGEGRSEVETLVRN
jgi:chromosome segregation ATPase